MELLSRSFSCSRVLLSTWPRWFDFVVRVRVRVSFFLLFFLLFTFSLLIFYLFIYLFLKDGEVYRIARITGGRAEVSEFDDFS